MSDPARIKHCRYRYDPDGWYRANGSRATFGFRVEGGEVVETAPYARKWLIGLEWADAWEKLYASGYEVESLR